MAFALSVQVPKSGFSVSLRLTTARVIETWQYTDNQVSIYRPYAIELLPLYWMSNKASFAF